MTNIITKQHFLDNIDMYIQEIQAGKIFIYPTDTVLGIGCDISFSESVEKIFSLKQRENKPLLTIIPNIAWVDNNCILSEENRRYISEKLPGAYSFVVQLQETVRLNPRLTNNGKTLGIRIPDNWFAEVISQTQNPFVSTSVNISGQPSCLSIDNIPKEIINGVDYVIHSDDTFLGKSSTLIDVTSSERKVLRK